MSRAQEILSQSLEPDGDIHVKLLSDTPRGRIYEFINLITGRTEYFRFVYPDGRSELRKVSYDPWVDGDR